MTSYDDDWDGTKEYNKKLREIDEAVAATIERCAQVALAFKVNVDDPRTAQEQLAAAIRALKEKPDA